jgi:TonB-linked SusC/RagA family outer membrane protein
MKIKLLLILLFSIIVTHAFSQVNITGKVTDYEGIPLPGVNVVVKGSTLGTITDVDGNYALNDVSLESTLVFSFVGMITEEIKVGEQTVIDMILINDILNLDEIVVIGYGTVKKRDLTGSVVSIKSDDVTITPTNNPMEAMQGRVAGMDIQRTSGAVGSGVSMLLRGTRSIYGNNSPLFIVDGIPADARQINPSDIESIDILKEASSTAIYGSAGANGVVIITTKRGIEGKTRVNFDAYHGISGDAYFLHGMTGDEYTDYRKEFYRTREGEYPQDDNMALILTDPNQLQAFEDGKWIDWVDEVLGGNVKQEKYNLSLETGNEKTKVFASFNIADEEGMLKNENQKLYGLRLNLDHKINNWAKIGASINLTHTDRNSRSSKIFTNSLRAFPLGDAYDEFGNVNYNYINLEITPLGDEIKDQYVDNTKVNYTNSLAYLELTPIAGLKLRSNVGVTLRGTRRGQYQGLQSVAPPINSTTPPVASIGNYYGSGYTWENILSYEKTLADDHTFMLTAISSWAESVDEQNTILAQGQELDIYSFHNVASGTNQQRVSSGYSKSQRMSGAGRINYSYQGKYLFSFTNRWDGVSRLAEGHKWDYFPSAAVAWRISDENFMQGLNPWLNNMKLRVSYGVTGNSGGLGPYSSQTNATTDQRITIGGQLVPHTLYEGVYGNPAIGWEKSYNQNIGLDLGLMNGRIDIAFDWYNTDTKDMLFLRKLPVTSGATSYGDGLSMWQNIGEMNNKGIEITVNSRNVQTRDFQWTSNISFTRNREEIVKLPEGDIISGDIILTEGYPAKHTFYNYKYLGIWSSDESEEADIYGVDPGDVKIETVPIVAEDGSTDNGEHRYGDADRQIIGSSTPDWILGFNNVLNYKSFDLTVFTMARWGQMLDSDLLGWYQASTVNQPSGIDYWTPENQGAHFPRPGTLNSNQFSALRYVDGSYIKIKNITLGYSLPANILNVIKMERVRIYATAYNPLIFTKEEVLKNTDPENNGSDKFPLYKTYVFGINVTF